MVTYEQGFPLFGHKSNEFSLFGKCVALSAVPRRSFASDVFPVSSWRLPFANLSRQLFNAFLEAVG